MKHRRGITLIEVLVAIFIMGIGLLAILTLFPLGVMTMAQALQDDRVAQAAANASALALAKDLRSDSVVNGAAGFGGATTPAVVYVDPYYQSLGSTTLGGVNGIPRCGVDTTVWTPNPPAGNVTRWFTLIDDYEFTQAGIPDATGNIIKSDGYYTWAYLLRRPLPGNTAFTDLSVVVYKGRTTQVVSGETLFTPVAGAQGSTTLTVPWQTVGQRPAIRKTGWILDVTKNSLTGQPQGYFYRVISMTDDPTTANQVILEVQTPLKLPVTSMVVMENVAEVMERGTGWKP